jgi:hypothetical protein
MDVIVQLFEWRVTIDSNLIYRWVVLTRQYRLINNETRVSLETCSALSLISIKYKAMAQLRGEAVKVSS